MSAMPSGGRRATLVLFALIALVIVLLHREVLFGGAVYHMDDAADGYYPCHVAIARAYREGALPSWERGAAAGWPLVADPYYGPFYPLGVLFAVFGPARGLGVQIVVHMLLCAGAMMWLLRRRGASPAAAAFGAASLALSSFMVCRIRHIIFPEGLAWLVVALCGVEGWLTTRRARELALVAGATGLTLLCGALPLLPFFGLFAVAYTLPRLRTAARPGEAALGLGAASLVGLLVAAAQLVPTLTHLPYSPRALGTSYEFASSYAWPRLSYLATLLVPDLFGVEQRGRWFGAFNHWEMAGYYTGAWALLLAPLAWARAQRGARLETALLWGVALVGVLLAFGDAGPLHGFFYRHLPLYAALRCPTRALVMTMLALSILGAEGLEALATRLGAYRRRRVTSALLVALGLCLGAAGVAIAVGLVRGRLFHGAPGPIPAAVLEGRRAFAQLAWVLGAGGLVVCLGATGRVARAVRPLFLVVALADLYAADRGYVQPQPFDYVAGTDRFQAMEWLLAQRPSDRFATDARGPFRLHNVGMTYGIEGAGAYSSVQLLRYVNFLEVLATGHGLPSPLRTDPAASAVRRFDSPLVDLLNVRWAVTDHQPAPGWIERFHPRPGAGGPAARHEPMWDARLGVWENPHPLPRAFVVYAAQVVVGEPAEQAALAALDPRRLALLDRVPQPAVPRQSAAPPTPARLTEASRTRLVIEAEAAAPGVLVVSEAHYPGWSATVDGAPAELLRADYAFRGVALAPGTHRIELRYRPRALHLGLLGSAVGLLLVVGLAFAGARPRGRRVAVLG